MVEMQSNSSPIPIPHPSPTGADRGRCHDLISLHSDSQ